LARLLGASFKRSNHSSTSDTCDFADLIAAPFGYDVGDLHACPDGEKAESQSKVVDALFLRERMEIVASESATTTDWGFVPFLCPFCALFDVERVVTN